MHFDGGYKHQGKCTDRRGVCYQDVPRKMTRYVAELWAAKDCLEFIEAQGYLKNHKTVVMRGDSQPIVNFMLRKYKPGPDFSPTVQAM